MMWKEELMKARGENMHIAEVAMHAERYNEMVEAMEKIAKTVEVEELTEDERNMLLLAYRNVMASREASWRIISSIQQKERIRGGGAGRRSNEDQGRYQAKIESEMSTLCERILNILDSYLIPNSTDGESSVSYLKMKGDYHWRLSEFKTGVECEKQKDFVIQAYKSAQDMALTELEPNHPIRLRLALNFSVFHHDVLDSRGIACSVAKQAVEEATSVCDRQGREESLPGESKLMVELLMRNFTCWRSCTHRTPSSTCKGHKK